MNCIRSFTLALLACTVATLPALANPGRMAPVPAPVVTRPPPPPPVRMVLPPLPVITPVIVPPPKPTISVPGTSTVTATSLPPAVKADIAQAADRSNKYDAAQAQALNELDRLNDVTNASEEEIGNRKSAELGVSNDHVFKLDRDRLAARREYETIKSAYETDPTPQNGQAREDAEQKLIAARGAFDKAEANRREISQKYEREYSELDKQREAKREIIRRTYLEAKSGGAAPAHAIISDMLLTR